jgi:hypothetical protein
MDGLTELLVKSLPVITCTNKQNGLYTCIAIVIWLLRSYS